ncbi:Set1 complex component spp1 [Penicillium rolfsii]|nr:Set1 complex component spp1 [Penicillium rolfsii]
MIARMEGPTGAHLTNGATSTKGTMGNPYETNPDRIPRDDPFLALSAQYGRYTPHPDDFTPPDRHWYQSDPEANTFWQKVAQKFCTSENSLNVPGSREAFAAGSVILRVDRESAEGAAAERYSCANANELSAARKVEESLKEIGVAVPTIFFCGTIEGRNVTVESRIPGVSLDVAWRYLSPEQIRIVKNQCRQIVQHLAKIGPPPTEPSYVCRGLNSQTPPSTHNNERDILLAAPALEEEFSLTHNDLVPANIIVKDDRIVGITGWRNSGYFGLGRAKKVHRQFRDSEPRESKKNTGVTWIDLYDDDYDASKLPHLVSVRDNAIPFVKTEPASDDLDTKSVGLDGANEYLTSKKLAGLMKTGISSRASSTDRSSPATSVKLTSNKKGASAATKKGTAKKPAPKKRKVNDADADSMDGRRSNTPASRPSKGPGKKQGSVSIAGSPAPDDVKRRSKEQPGDDEDEDVEDENELFCICRRPDNHTWMIGCDGECEDWFHGKCVNIDPRDAELIDKYICPNCSKRDNGFTTWKPMCRLPECRKPARVTRKNPSKYCSDEHGREFMIRQTRQFKLGPARKGQEDLGSMGGILTPGDLKAAILGVSSVEEFRKLGNQIISTPTESIRASPASDVKNETKTPDADKLFDVHASGVEFSADEAAKIEKLRQRRDDLLHRKEMLAARSTFVGLVRQRSKAVVEKLKQNEPKGGWKDICGFDSRLAWADEEFDEWRLSDAGKKALEEGTPQAMAASYPTTTDADGDVAMDSDEKEDAMALLTRGICIKKRCERHKQWVKVQQQDIVFEENAAEQDLKKLEQEARSVAERAVLRKWAEKENVPSVA